MAAKWDNLDGIQLPFVRTKRPHRKSRLGCLSCKQRRVKCDEKQPACTACQVRAQECVYRDPEAPAVAAIPFKRANSDADAGALSSSAESSPMDAFTPGILEVSETELVQCYLGDVAATFSSSNCHVEQHWIYHVFIPTLAYTSKPVRYGMLTAAAIYRHFSTIALGEPYSTRYFDAAVSYGSAFVEQSRSRLQRLDPAETDANIACARLLSGLAFAFFRHDRRDGMQLDSPQAWTWLHLLLGVKLIHEQMAVAGQHIDPLLLRDLVPELVLKTDEPIIHVASPESSHFISNEVLAYIERTRYDRYAALRALVYCAGANLDEIQSEACFTALELLIKTTDYVCTAEVQSMFRVLCTWIGELPQPFVYMLRNAHDVALAIYTHWLMLVILAREWWWIDDMGREGIRDVLNHMGPDFGIFRTALSWPREILGLSSLTPY